MIGTRISLAQKFVDCPVDRGGLAVAAGSHISGVWPITYTTDWFGFKVLDDDNLNWYTTDYNAGDVVIFHSLCVHKGLPNRSTSFRISADCRYQRSDDLISENCLKLLGQNLTWPEVYSDWSNPELKYYWQKEPLKVVQFDNSYEEDRDNKVLKDAMGIPSHEFSIGLVNALRRMSKYSNNLNHRKSAKKILES